jgi:GNAT superfamily N-acetyltransferase
MTITVRPAVAADLPALPAIELSGDVMFADLGIVFPAGPATVEGAIVQGADILVAGGPPEGFTAVIGLDGHPHLEQISVRADQTGKGIGSLLLAEVTHRAGPGLTLITFQDVPWNGPWYRRNGFIELPERDWGPQLRAHWQAEVDVGLHDLGPRFVLCSSGDRPANAY